MNFSTPKPRPKSNPFGSSIKSRSYSAGSEFRFGFNGKEKQGNIVENTYTFEFRIYNSGLGRFLSTDPDMKKYSWQTPYAYYCNSPIYIIDYLGLGKGEEAPKWLTDKNSSKNKREIKKFKRLLDKEDKKQMDLIEQMGSSIEKTKAVDGFVLHINETYKDKRLYRSFVSRKTGENSIYSLASIWANNVDESRKDLIEAKYVDKVWKILPNGVYSYNNNTGTAQNISTVIKAVNGFDFQTVKISIKIGDPNIPEKYFEEIIEKPTVTEYKTVNVGGTFLMHSNSVPPLGNESSNEIGIVEFVNAYIKSSYRGVNPVTTTPQSINRFIHP